MKPEDVHNWDQGTKFLVENLPPLWRGLFEGCKKAGFTEMESFRLLQTYILSQAPNGVNGTE